MRVVSGGLGLGLDNLDFWLWFGLWLGLVKNIMMIEQARFLVLILYQIPGTLPGHGNFWLLNCHKNVKGSVLCTLIEHISLQKALSVLFPRYPSSRHQLPQMKCIVHRQGTGAGTKITCTTHALGLTLSTPGLVCIFVFVPTFSFPMNCQALVTNLLSPISPGPATTQSNPV